MFKYCLSFSIIPGPFLNWVAIGYFFIYEQKLLEDFIKVIPTKPIRGIWFNKDEKHIFNLLVSLLWSSFLGIEQTTNKNLSYCKWNPHLKNYHWEKSNKNPFYLISGIFTNEISESRRILNFPELQYPIV